MFFVTVKYLISETIKYIVTGKTSKVSFSLVMLTADANQNTESDSPH